MKKNTIQTNYFDALFYANSTSTEKSNFHISPNEFKLILKLIHYSTKQSNITWVSSEISKHISMPIGAIDKAIQRLKQKGYINTSTYNTGETTRYRTIFINWDKIEEINNLYLNELEIPTEVAKSEAKELSTPIDVIVPEVEEEVSTEVIESETSELTIRLDRGYDVTIPTEMVAYYSTLSNSKLKTLLSEHSPKFFIEELTESFEQHNKMQEMLAQYNNK